MRNQSVSTGWQPATPMSRRRFVARAATIGVAGMTSSLLAACSRLGPVRPAAAPATLPAEQTVAPPAAGSAQVAFVKTSDRADGVRRALELLAPIDLAGKRIVVKPNFNSADPAPGSTHPDVLRTLLAHLAAAGPASLTLADRSGMGDTRRVMEIIGADNLAKEYGCECIVLDELDADAWEMVTVAGGHWQQGFPFPRFVREADVVVQACCLKTHRYGGHFTLSLKNSVGLVAKYLPGDGYNYMSELHNSRHQRTLIAEINTAYAPALVVIDGVEAFVRGGPASGERVAANVVLAGSDRVALDAVGVALLRYFGTTAEVSQGPIFGQEQIARAVELGLGVSSPQQITLVTDDTASAAFASEIEGILAAG